MAKSDKKKQRPAGTQSIPRKILKTIVYGGIGIFAFVSIYSVTVIAHAPKIDTDNLYSYLSESSTLYDDKGNVIDSIFTSDGNRVNLDYDEMPQDMVNAVVAIEDKTFWDHHGFNIIRIFGAIWESLTGGGDISGTSTITQQLARNVYLADTKSVRSLNRKVTEAWYTVILEHNLTKEQIMEAYLNTIYLGYNCYGVESAANAYFSKSAKDLDLTECATLAALPKSPDTYAPIKNYTVQDFNTLTESVNKDYVLKESGDYVTVYNGEASQGRRELVLQFMKEQGYIDDAQYTAAMESDLFAHIKLPPERKGTSYFTDFVIEEVVKDLMEEGYTEQNARKLVYTGGLHIYTTLDSNAQAIIEKEFGKSGNFPAVRYYNEPQDKDGNLLTSKKQVMLYKKSTFLKDDQFTFKSDEWQENEDGSVTLFKNKRLNFYDTQTAEGADVSVEFKAMYTIEKKVFYDIENSYVNIPYGYKSKDADGNLVLRAELFTDYPNLLIKSDGKLIIPEGSYTLGQKVRQPQAAMVLCDNKTGAVKAMVGGRSVTGDKLYNRALSPRQPGSAIKPLAVYSTALQQGVDAMKAGGQCDYWQDESHTKIKDYGRYWTAASLINDAPYVQNGKEWPKNAYRGYRGSLSMRTAIENSCNVPAVRVLQQVRFDNAADNLEKLGITSVKRDGDENDLNPAALALGGMFQGISPLEMASAYTTFPAMGIHREYTCYTEIKNSKGEVVLTANPKETRVLDEGVAFIMCDILRTTVSNGISSAARTWAQTTSGKTGTTTDQCDAWFCGFTPQYTGAIWMGNDVNLELTEGSQAASRMWATIMNQVTKDMDGSFPKPPSSVIKYKGEYFVDGTQKGAVIRADDDKLEEKVNVETCADSGYIATPWCTNRATVTMNKGEPKATYYCPIHNHDTGTYKVAPGTQTNTDTTPAGGGGSGGGTTPDPGGGGTTPDPGGGGTTPDPGGGTTPGGGGT